MEGLIDVPHPVFRVWIGAKDVTADLTPYLLSVSYADAVEGEADTLSVRLEDVDGRMRGPWYPAKGQTMAMAFGYADQPLQQAGHFEIDEIELSGPPDTVSLKGIAAGVKGAQRTRQGRSYDNTTLAEIARQVARRLKLHVVGKIEPIQIRRVTQVHETDLVFMHRLAGEYGYAFSVKGAKMVFFKRAELRGAAPILVIDRADITRYHVRDKIMGIAKSGVVTYHDPKSKRTRKQKVEDTSRATSDYEVKVNVRAESDAQAKVKAKAALERANEDGTVLELTLYGNQRLVSGVNFMLTGMGKVNGAYHVVKSRHDIERGGGYRTEIEAKRVPENKKPVKPAAKRKVRAAGQAKAEGAARV